MATITDLEIKRGELNAAVDAYAQSVRDLSAGTATQTDVDDAKAIAQAKGDEYAKLMLQVSRDNPEANPDDFFSNPGRMNALVRDDIATIMRTGRFHGGPMKLLIDTEGSNVDETNIVLSFAEGCDIEIDWGDGSDPRRYTGAASHDYDSPGQYVVQITGTVNGFTQPGGLNYHQIKDVMQWGSVEFASMDRMFQLRRGFTISASDRPTLLPGCSLRFMFISAVDFNSDISHWDMSNAVDTHMMFGMATSFNGDLSKWDMSGVTNTSYMFREATAFNQPLAQWDVSNVTDMSHMFIDATSFNQDLSEWSVAQVVDYADFNSGGIMNEAYLPNFQ